MTKGYIALHRSLVDWEWYKDLPVRCLFIHLLLKANHSEKSYKGKIIKRGQYLIGRENLAIESGLTVQQVRTGLLKLKSTQEITIETTNGYHLINIENYCLYQKKDKVSNQRNNQRITNDQPTDNQRITTNNNENNENNPPISPQGEEGDFFISKKANDLVWGLTSENREEARQHAKGLCLHKLANIFLNRKEKPDFRNIEAAFIGWIKCYTKKKQVN